MADILVDTKVKLISEKKRKMWGPSINYITCFFLSKRPIWRKRSWVFIIAIRTGYSSSSRNQEVMNVTHLLSPHHPSPLLQPCVIYSIKRANYPLATQIMLFTERRLDCRRHRRRPRSEDTPLAADVTTRRRAAGATGRRGAWGAAPLPEGRP